MQFSKVPLSGDIQLFVFYITRSIYAALGKRQCPCFHVLIHSSAIILGTKERRGCLWRNRRGPSCRELYSWSRSLINFLIFVAVEISPMATGKPTRGKNCMFTLCLLLHTFKLLYSQAHTYVRHREGENRQKSGAPRDTLPCYAQGANIRFVPSPENPSTATDTAIPKKIHPSWSENGPIQDYRLVSAIRPTKSRLASDRIL